MHRPVPAILLVALVAGACAPAPEPPSTVLTAAAAATPVAVTASPRVSPAPTLTPAANPTLTPAPTVAATGARTPATPPTPIRPTQPATLPTPAPSLAVEPVATEQPGARTAVNLARTGDFVPQYTFEWCVGASIQMTRSIVTGDREESRASQRRYWEMARERTIGSPYGGANPAGWTAALNDLGLGPYRLVSLPSFDAALTRAARALAETGRPVGLVMWAGRHAWVMTGYEATGDPDRDRDARITHVRVMDPLHPHGSRWGPSPEPNQLVSRKALARQFVLRDRPEYDFGMEPGWLLVLPVS